MSHLPNPTDAKREMDAFRLKWTATNSATERVIIAGQILEKFGDNAVKDQQDKGWPCEMLRSVARMQSIF